MSQQTDSGTDVAVEKTTMREQVKSHLLGLIVVPGVVVATLSFIVGYLVNDIAGATGENEAFKVTSTKIVDLAQRAGEKFEAARQFEEQANDLLQRMRKSELELKSTREEALELKDEIATVHLAATSTENLVAKIVDSLSKNESFRQHVMGDFQERLTRLEEVGSKTRQPGDQILVPGAGPWGAWNDARCPANEYVCAIGQKVEGKQGKGDDTAMNGVRFRCCPL